MTAEQTPRKIIIAPNGPYLVEGGIRLYVFSQEMSPQGEPLNWVYEGEITPDTHPYLLCRCGKSKTFPFCDSTHLSFHFNGKESAVTQKPLNPDLIFHANDGLTIRKFNRLCMSSGFCMRVSAGIEDFSEFSDDPEDQGCHQDGGGEASLVPFLPIVWNRKVKMWKKTIPCRLPSPARA